jgi:PadR family transcriptional regulator PadR
MGRKKTDLLQGSLDLLVLKTLSLESLHGWGISKRIRQWSSGVLEVNQGSLYPALYRLEDRGLIASAWGVSPEGRRAKLYRLTEAGRSRLAEEREGWRRFAGAVEAILATG